MGLQKRKGHSGAATNYISRKRAMRKLHLSLKDFRRLCILKGIYPHEPKFKRKVAKGNSKLRTYYYLKDIQFLSHEPIIKKLRSFKIFVKKLKRAKGRKDYQHVKWLHEHPPKFKVDHIVKERYPTFIDAIRDLEDGLCMCFLFATLPAIYCRLPLISLCRRLTIEFMHYVIESRSLRKVFISIKGYYFQADIQGQTVTWIVPHRLPYQTPSEVDFKIMTTFVDFYSTLLGFVNYKLYSLIHLHYPPELSTVSGLMNDTGESSDFATSDEIQQEHLVALNQSLHRVVQVSTIEDPAIDEFQTNESPEVVEKIKKEQARSQRLQKLFEGLKFFLGREVPREEIVFIIRCFGGDVSWDKTTNIGATYGENDPNITHHIIDRPQIPKRLTARYYIQPQWVFDCVNNCMLLPVEDYFPGLELPPHLSPFVEEAEGDYVPPEKLVLLERQGAVDSDEEVIEHSSGKKRNTSGVKGPVQHDETPGDQLNDKKVTATKKKRKNAQTPGTLSHKNNEPKEQKKARMSVEPGTVSVVDEEKKAKEQAAEEKQLAIMMIPKRNKRLYHQIMYGKRKKLNEAAKLKKKRILIENQKSASKTIDTK